MTESLLFRRSLIAAAVVAAGAAAYGCGGGESHGDTASVTQAATVDAGADVRSSVLVVGGGSGFVARALSAGLKPGNKAGFDVLVLDASADKDSLAMAEEAIENGKRVVIDGTGEANAGLARKLGGMAPAADAVMVMKAKDEDGYIVVPIDNARNAAKRKLAAQAANPTVAAADLQVNAVQSVFGLQQATEGESQ